jgi:predicted deacylase
MTGPSRVRRSTTTVPLGSLSSGHRVDVVVHHLEGDQPGPCLGLVGGIHGDEPVTVDFVRRILDDLAETPLRGTVTAIPCANPFAYQALTRNTPIDMLDLNRVFPGDPDGLFTHQLAHSIAGIFKDKCDFFIDFHCGGLMPVVDYVYVQGDEGLARSLGAKVLYTGAPYVGALSDYLRQHGVRSTVVELGGGQVDNEPYALRAIAAVRNALRYLGMLDGSPEARTDQILVSELRTLRAHHGGMLISNVRVDQLGQTVPKGQELGRILSCQTLEEMEVLRAPFESSVLILVRQGFTPIGPGDFAAYMLGNATEAM